ncbi:DapH/DapD/GlmU-related protein [Mesorhizobium sp. ZMM04-5]|uniref:DapH/DapD/GlmU-related protein n=1 Tax=Mesorhizobium marinum TaxID=3228790 RepID=A0ABV3R2W7_9HYPH
MNGCAHILIGDGGHARACRDVASGQFERLFHLSDVDDGKSERLGSFDDIGRFPDARFHLAIGPSRARTELAGRLLEAGTRWFSLKSALAVVRTERIGEGVFVGHQSYVGPNAALGHLTIVNTAAIVEHDCVIGDGAFVGPGAVLCGGVRVGSYAMIGAGVVVVPRMEIEQGARIPAGVVVR